MTTTITQTDALAPGLLLRLGDRENAERKALRLLVTGRVMVKRLDSRGVLADVRGDSGAVRTIVYERGSWSCSCPARSRCAHARAVQLVVDVGT